MRQGDNVRVGRHWLRGKYTGKLVKYDGVRENEWLVQFDEAIPGGGFTLDDDHTGPQHLWLDERQLLVID